jgi:hypothetical protein
MADRFIAGNRQLSLDRPLDLLNLPHLAKTPTARTMGATIITAGLGVL